MEGIVLRMVLSLAAVLALMVGLLYAVKRFVLPGTGSARLPVQVEVLGRRALQPKKAILVVRVAGRVLVLGTSEQGIQALAELSDEELQGAVAAQTGVTPAPPLPFATYLQETLRTMRHRQKSEAGA